MFLDGNVLALPIKFVSEGKVKPTPNIPLELVVELTGVFLFLFKHGHNKKSGAVFLFLFKHGHNKKSGAELN